MSLLFQKVKEEERAEDGVQVNKEIR